MKFLKRFVLFVLLAVALGAGYVGYRLWSSLPMLEGTITHASLAAPVQVLRDDWGVPHITAENEADAYFALGYVTGQDRLFQMELLRRIARGELAALLGPWLAPVDAMVRAFRLQPKAEAFYAAHSNDSPEVRVATEAFIAGLNHRLENEPLPVEYTLLGIPKRPFTAVDCLTIAAILPISFAEGLRGDPLKSLIQAKHPDLPVDLLFPGYDLEDPPVTVMETLEEARAFLAEQAPETAAAPAAVEPLAALEPVLDAMGILHTIFGTTLGSNSWVLDGTQTKSGKPILASDPHIAITNPSIWYEAHLRYPGMDNYGYYIPLIPFALLGHNREHAWAITMFENDDVDIYREAFDPADPKRVMHKGQWVDAGVEISSIPVRLGADVECEVRTTPHGPVITDLLRFLLEYEGPDLSMSWVWQHLEYTDLLAFYRLPRAKSVAEFEAAVALITSPGLNISYADAAGNIAWWAAGRIVIRPEGTDNKVILDGASGKDDILGYVPFALNPKLINPAWGSIVSSNNLSTVKPVGPVKKLEGYWQPSDRAGRIEALLAARNDWDLESLKAVQFDDHVAANQQVAGLMAGAVRGHAGALSATEQAALEALSAWDGTHGLESVGATVAAMGRDMAIRRLLQDELGETLLENYASLADAWNFFKYGVQHPELPFWDDVTTPVVETRDNILVAAFREAVTVLTEDLGTEVSGWRWERVHTIGYQHPLGLVPGLGWLFNLGPVPSPGADNAVNNLETLGLGDYRVIAGPSTRRLIDFGDPEHSLTVLPTGNAGHPLSPHYGDQVPLYVRGDYREVRLTDAQIAEHQRHALTFEPGS
jgi:penicillin amidase